MSKVKNTMLKIRRFPLLKKDLPFNQKFVCVVVASVGYVGTCTKLKDKILSLTETI